VVSAVALHYTIPLSLILETNTKQEQIEYPSIAKTERKVKVNTSTLLGFNPLQPPVLGYDEEASCTSLRTGTLLVRRRLCYNRAASNGAWSRAL
jgi:hypothetical protein